MKLKNILIIISLLLYCHFVIATDPIPYIMQSNGGSNDSTVIFNNATVVNETNYINQFDQSLNTTDDVTFNSVSAPNICYSDGSNCIAGLSLLDIVANIGNWSQDQFNYPLISYVNSLGNWSSEKSNYAPLSYVNSLGNWSNVSYQFNTTSQLNSLYLSKSGNNTLTGNLNVTGNISANAFYLNKTGNICIFFNGSAIVINNNANGVVCP